MSSRPRRVALAALASLFALALAGCANAQAAKPAGGVLKVYAAASLTASFDDLTASFAAQHPGVVVKPVTYDGSSTLATQLNEGAPADVFASADQATMDEVTRNGLVAGSPTVFATNVLEIAVRPGNPKHISGLADLAKPGVLTVLCAPEVPCGSASHTLLARSDVHLTPASEEQNVKAVITKVALGEADAGLVYVTDVSAAGGKVDGVRLPDARAAENHYPIAVLKTAESPAVAREFVNYVLSQAGRKTLAAYGFGKP